MHAVTPSVYLIASTQVDATELARYLSHIGAPDWQSDADSDVEEIVEVMGRGCYKSFGPGLNPNVTKVRGSNKEYIANLIDVEHGSVLENAWASFQICDVSRVLTHELVRHRVGTAISQESLRFVRLEDIGLWIPSCFKDNPEAVQAYEEAVLFAEMQYAKLLAIAAAQEGVGSFNKLPFSKKKVYTSAARRVAPEGLATNIGWSVNMRALRNIIELRTNPGAEEEIRLVFDMIANIARENWPNLFADYELELADNINWWKTDNRKI